MVRPNNLVFRIIYGDLHLDFVRRNYGIICEMFAVIGDGARSYEATITHESPEYDVEVIFKALNYAEYLQGLTNFTIVG